MKRKILSILLIFCMCMTVLPQGAIVVSAAEESAAELALSGSGNENDPYLITSAEDLKELAEKVKGGTPYTGEYFRLEADITLSGEWTPIGTEQNPFKGTFNGADHTITGLSITSNTSSAYVGLFGYINTAKIQNLTVKGTVNVADTGGLIYVGGIVGYNKDGTVTNCRNEGTANVAGKRIYVGGIVGYNNGGTVTNCRNENTINIVDGTSGSSFVGGIVGQDYVGAVTNCRNHGKVMNTKQIACAGGIVGGNNNAPKATTIENCWNEGEVTGNNAGGIMGQAYSSTSTTIENCWNEGEVTGDNAGGIVGYNQGKENITNCGNQGEVMGDNAGEIVGYNNRYSGNTTMTNCYYLDTTANKDVGDGTVEGTAEVKTSTEFASGKVAWLLQNGQEADEGDGAQKTLVWGQRLGVDDFPRLACFMEEDDAAKEKNRVLKVAFYNATNAETYTEYGDKPYINKGATVQDAGGAEVSSQGYLAESYEAVWLDSAELTEDTYSGTIFGKGTPIEKDTEFYLFYKELFSSEDAALTTSSGTAETKDLDKCIKYAESGDAAGNFTYEITAGNDELKATVSDNELTIPSTAAVGSYELTITATEETAQMENQKDSVTVTGTDSTTFKLSVTVKKSDRELVEQAKEVVEKALDEMAVTNDTTKDNIQKAIDEALKEAGLNDVTATVDEFDKTEATKEAEGRITGKVTIKKGAVDDSVEIDKTIEQLPKTDADYVAEAKKIVEEVLEGMPVTNDTTKDDIQKAIDEALKEAGLSDVTATVDEFDKTEATKEAEGNITGKVTIAKGDESAGVDIDRSISNKGIVKKDTHSKAGAPEADLPMGEEDLADAVLTETDRQAIEDGKNINLLLTVESVNNTISTTDKQKVEEGASYYTVGQYLDINLIKMVNTDNPEEGTPVTKTKAPIEIVITIPEEMKKDNRNYAVVRVHEGETALLEDMDDDPETVTIATDRFSTYAMVYTEITHEERLAGAKEVLSKVLEDLTATNNTTKESIQQAVDAALKEAGFSDVTATVGELTKKDATRETAGSLIGAVTITKGKAGDSVSINKTIAKLPQDSTVTPPPDSTVTPEQQKKNEFALNEGLKVDQKGKKINVAWGKVKDADGYLVYLQYCGKRFDSKPTKVIKSASITKASFTKINGKKLNLKRNYKVYVAAYKKVNGKKVRLGKTIIAHVVGKQKEGYTNAKGIKLAKSSYTLTVGTTATIKAKTILVDKKKEQLSDAHTKEFRYRSTDTGVATVSAKGKITAKAKGACTIYVYTRNGYAKKIKVTVK